MPYRENADSVIRIIWGFVGTYLSVALNVVSVLVSITAGVITVMAMYQVYKNNKAQGKAFKEDRENEKLENEDS